MSQVTAPKVSELQDKVGSILSSCGYVTSRGIPVVVDDGTKTSQIDKALRTKSCCVVVNPITGATTRDQSGSGWIVDCDIVVEVKSNPKRRLDGDSDVVKLNVLECVSEIVAVMTNAARHRGGEFFKADREAFRLSQFDEGILVYYVFFTKEALL